MEENSFDDIIFSKVVLEFVTVAKEYCSIIENHAQYSLKEFLSNMQKIFPLLYLKATLLPRFDNDDIEESEKHVSEVEYNFLLNKLGSRIGRFDSYQEVFDANMQFSEGSLDASIAENICDIYQDAKDFLVNYRIGSSDIMVSALYDCQNNFENYWGQKLVNGLRAIHNLLYSNTDWNENAEEAYNADDVPPMSKGGWVDNHFSSFMDETDNYGE